MESERKRLERQIVALSGYPPLREISEIIAEKRAALAALDGPAGFRRGIDRGVALAKEKARVAVHSATDDGRDVTIARIDWTDVDAAAAKAKGDA